MSDLAIAPVAGSLGDYHDPAVFVELALTRAKEWLVQCVDHGDIESIVELKSQAEAIRAYTVQKQLGKDTELNAQEIVRRAERGLGLAIRKGQAEGTVAKPGASHFQGNQWTRGETNDVGSTTSPLRYFQNDSEREGSYAVTDGVADDQFEQAIEEAREEKNLSRANVVRKVKGEPKPKPADRSEWHYGTQRIQPERVIEEAIALLEGVASGLSLIKDDIPSIPIDKRLEWIEALKGPLAVINHTRKVLSQ